MRIAFFTDTYYPTIDGVVSTIENYQKELEKRKVQIKIFAPAPENNNDKKVGVEYASSIAFPSYSQYRIPIFTFNLEQECRKFGPELIHSHAMVIMGLEAKKIAKKLKVPLLGTFHTFLPNAAHYIIKNEGLQLWFKELCWKYLKYFYRDFDGVISPSYFVQKKLKENGIESKYVIPNGLNTSFFRPYRKKIKKEYFLYLGRIAKEKNLDLLLQIAGEKEFSSLNIPIVLAGDGPYRQELENSIKKAKLDNIKLIGKVPKEQLPIVYSKAYGFISLSEFETFGMSALEAMACKVPIICLKDTALEELTKNKGGLACYKETYQIIENIKIVLEQQKKFSEAAYKTAQNYSIQKTSKMLIELYKKFI
ncbi:MAG: glycosyltransferase [Candidatus Micrarchaeota archaeon]|nr:glycosyltransferase [Candidatus Micrarchaeota archaeon]